MQPHAKHSHLSSSLSQRRRRSAQRPRPQATSPTAGLSQSIHPLLKETHFNRRLSLNNLSLLGRTALTATLLTSTLILNLRLRLLPTSTPLRTGGRRLRRTVRGALLWGTVRSRSIAGRDASGESAVLVFKLVLGDAHEFAGASCALQAGDFAEFFVVDLDASG